MLKWSPPSADRFPARFSAKADSAAAQSPRLLRTLAGEVHCRLERVGVAGAELAPPGVQVAAVHVLGVVELGAVEQRARQVHFARERRGVVGVECARLSVYASSVSR